MTLFSHLEGRLSRSVGNNQDNQEDDVRLVKRRLNHVGYFDKDISQLEVEIEELKIFIERAKQNLDECKK